VIIQTARLSLRPYCDPDVDQLHALWTDPGVRRFLWDDLVISSEQAAEVVARSVADWADRGYGQWVIGLHGCPALAGFCGFRPASWSNAPELLFGLAPPYWRQGLATEAGRAALAFIFNLRHVDRTVAATDVANVASLRVLERIGMRRERRALLNGLDTVFFQLRAEEWRTCPSS
jgi:ribosomal-protein-alanine N-acetyltransferase